MASRNWPNKSTKNTLLQENALSRSYEIVPKFATIFLSPISHHNSIPFHISYHNPMLVPCHNPTPISRCNPMPIASCNPVPKIMKIYKQLSE